MNVTCWSLLIISSIQFTCCLALWLEKTIDVTNTDCNGPILILETTQGTCFGMPQTAWGYWKHTSFLDLMTELGSFQDCVASEKPFTYMEQKTRVLQGMHKSPAERGHTQKQRQRGQWTDI